MITITYCLEIKKKKQNIYSFSNFVNLKAGQRIRICFRILSMHQGQMHFSVIISVFKSIFYLKIY
jgi:hypothetical protein